MTGFQRSIVIAAIVNTGIYMLCFVFQMLKGVINDTGPELNSLFWISWHFAGMFLNAMALALTIRDLYLRRFENANSKLTWCLLIIGTGGIGWLVYLCRHGLKPRPEFAIPPQRNRTPNSGHGVADAASRGNNSG